MVSLFFAETERRIAMFRRGVDLVGRKAIEVEAHSLKGGARTLGFHAIAEIAYAVERDAQSVSAESLDLLAGQLSNELVELRRHYEGAFKLAS